MKPHATSYRAKAPDWRQFSACIGEDPELFFPEQGGSTQPARAICNGTDEHPPCPVRQRCLETYMGEKFGVFGGTSERERRRLRAGLPAKAKPAEVKARKRSLQGPTWLPARPLAEALRALVGPVYPSINQLSLAVGREAGTGKTGVDRFVKGDREHCSLEWATKVTRAVGLDLDAIYPERKEQAA